MLSERRRLRYGGLRFGGPPSLHRRKIGPMPFVVK
jgi:hypothetical protein